ncbi:MAG TPA: hypothetical protein VNI61_06650 [Gemmatimonadales bacterium]|nr:hypothetical protein [Gemmatimonadales bacterium]
MFVGHLALGFAAKRVAPGVSLGWLVAAVVALDLVWPVFLLAGLEQVRIEPGATAFTPLVFQSYPWSHSLLTAVAWGGVLVGIARRAGVARSVTGLLIVLTASHWLLDAATHAPDLPLWPGPSPRVGLGLWNSLAGTFLVEGTLWVAGLALYLRARPLAGRGPRLAFWSFVLVTTAMWVAGPWSPPPPDPRALAWFALAGWIVLPWAALADRRPPQGAGRGQEDPKETGPRAGA